MSVRQLAGMAIVAIAIGVVATKFLAAASNNAAAMSAGACRALQPDPVPGALQNREAPDFELADATGKRWSLRALRGRPVLLNFWATWCPPCVEEMASMEDLARQMGDRAVILAVSVDKDWDAVRKFFSRGTPLSVLLDAAGEIPKRFGTEKYPESFLVDGAGKVRHYFINQRNWAQAEAAMCLDSIR